MLYSKIEGEGKPFIIMHGFLGMSDNWKTLGTQFASEGYQVHMLDLRNHGRSFHSDDFNYKAMVQDVYEYCTENKLETVDMLGHSMGGKVAMFFAMQYPEKVNKLIIADIGPKYYRPHHQDILAGLNAVDFSQKPERSEVEEILKGYVDDFGTRQFLMKSLYWKEPGQLAFRFNLEVFNKEIENIGEALNEEAVFDKPTLFIKGGSSNYIKEDDYDSIKRQFPEAQIEIIENAGHWLHAENPKEFYQKTINFLKQ
ncbi:MAG: alpha/beta fold hydrolase [Flavobacterium sp.]|nr:MAG: alpha/beta fold hydrolase [Flavobacterium sp.]